MIKTLAVALILSGITVTTYAQGAFETRDQQRQRNSAENWNTYQRNGGNAPLGGYNSPLGSSPQRGTERPGYNSPVGGGFNSGTNNNGFNSNPHGGNQRRY